MGFSGDRVGSTRVRFFRRGGVSETDSKNCSAESCRESTRYVPKSVEDPETEKYSSVRENLILDLDLSSTIGAMF